MPAFETTASKKKMGLVLIGALCFVALGAWLAFFPEQFSESRRGGLAKYAGWASIIFFGFCSLIAVKQLFNSSVQIRIDDAGVYAKKVSTQTIIWADIEAVEALEMTVASNKQKFAILRLREDSNVEFTRSHKLSQRAKAPAPFIGHEWDLYGQTAVDWRKNRARIVKRA